MIIQISASSIHYFDIDGTATVSTEDGLFSDTPISICILSNGPITSPPNKKTNIINPRWTPEGGTTGVWIHPEMVHNHYGNIQIYGIVKKSDILE